MRFEIILQTAQIVSLTIGKATRKDDKYDK
jgi:hypothetical protein